MHPRIAVESLSRREVEVLRGAADGRTNQQIAETFGSSTRRTGIPTTVIHFHRTSGMGPATRPELPGEPFGWPGLGDSTP